MSVTLAGRARSRERVELPGGDAERYAGWGVMGLPFASGHILAYRRWPVSSIGPGYSSVWHRDPAGRWRMWADVEPERSCPRYFSAALESSHLAEIDAGWTEPDRLTVRIPGVLEWTLEAGPTIATRTMNALMAALPERAWRSPTVLQLMSPVAGAFLRAGEVALVGRTPNGHRFRAGPNRIWVVHRATATLEGSDLGPIGPVPEQARLGDFRIPQRGVVAFGRAWFDRPDDG